MPHFTRILCLLIGLLAGGVVANATAGKPSDDPSPPPQKALNTVDSLRAVGDFRTALGLLNGLSQEYPGSVEVLWRLAVLWSDYGKAANDKEVEIGAYHQALVRADQALQADPNSAWAHLAKAVASGRAAIRSENNKKRIELSRTVKDHADRALALDPTLAAAYYVRGVWHSEVADLGLLSRVVARAAYGGLPNASFEQAVADLQRAIALEDRVHNHLELGQTYLKMGKTDAAREQLKIALELPPVDPFALEDKAKARRLLDNLG